MNNLNGKSLYPGTHGSICIDFSGVIITYANLLRLKSFMDISRRSKYFININIFNKFSVGFAGICTLRILFCLLKKPLKQQQKNEPKLTPEMAYN